MTSEEVGYVLSITTAPCREPNDPMKVEDQSLKARNLPASLLSVWNPLQKSSMLKLAQECDFLGPVPKTHTGLSVQHRLHLNLTFSFFFFRWPSRDALVTGIRVCTDS